MITIQLSALVLAGEMCQPTQRQDTCRCRWSRLHRVTGYHRCRSVKLTDPGASHGRSSRPAVRRAGPRQDELVRPDDTIRQLTPFRPCGFFSEPATFPRRSALCRRRCGLEECLQDPPLGVKRQSSAPIFSAADGGPRPSHIPGPAHRQLTPFAVGPRRPPVDSPTARPLKL